MGFLDSCLCYGNYWIEFLWKFEKPTKWPFRSIRRKNRRQENCLFLKIYNTLVIDNY